MTRLEDKVGYNLRAQSPRWLRMPISIHPYVMIKSTQGAAKNATRLIRCRRPKVIVPDTSYKAIGEAKSAIGPITRRVTVFEMDIKRIWVAVVSADVGPSEFAANVRGRDATIDPMLAMTISHCITCYSAVGLE